MDSVLLQAVCLLCCGSFLGRRLPCCAVVKAAVAAGHVRTRHGCRAGAHPTAAAHPRQPARLQLGPAALCAAGAAGWPIRGPCDAMGGAPRVACVAVVSECMRSFECKPRHALVVRPLRPALRHSLDCTRLRTTQGSCNQDHSQHRRCPCLQGCSKALDAAAARIVAYCPYMPDTQQTQEAGRSWDPNP